MLPKTLEEMCDLFDCQVLAEPDMDDSANFTGQWGFCLGSRGDMSVGIFPFELTPCFDSEVELRAYVESDDGRTAINAEAAEIFLDDWNSETQDWAN